MLAKCFAGCTFEDIRAALWSQGVPVGSRMPVERASAPKPTSTPAAASEPRPLPSGPYDTVSLYHYSDGAVAFASVRHQPPGKAKRFSQWTPAGGDLWFDKNPLKSLPLYRLPQIVGADKVIIVEGEKCVHAVMDAWPHIAVTTWAGGSGAWRKTDFGPLVGKDVSICADADDDAPPDKPNAKSRPGQTAAMEIAAHLHTLGCHVRVALPDPDGGADIADWLAVGKAHAKDLLAGLLHDYEPPPYNGGDLSEPTPEDEPAYLDRIASNPHYRVLGLVGDVVAIRIAAGRVLQRTGSQ